MNAAAWSALLEGLSSYAGTASAYCFVRPALQAEHLRSNSELLREAEQHPEAEFARLATEMKATVEAALTGSLPRRHLWNRFGFFFLVVSAILLASAIGIHLHDQRPSQ